MSGSSTYPWEFLVPESSQHAPRDLRDQLAARELNRGILSISILSILGHAQLEVDEEPVGWMPGWGD